MCAQLPASLTRGRSFLMTATNWLAAAALGLMMACAPSGDEEATAGDESELSKRGQCAAGLKAMTPLGLRADLRAAIAAPVGPDDTSAATVPSSIRVVHNYSQEIV